MSKKKENTFFTKDIYDSEIALEVNADVLERIYNSNVSSQDNLPIEFDFISDSEKKLKTLGIYLLSIYPNYSALKVAPYEDLFELHGITEPIQMELDIINEWNKQMWDIGFEFDCKLDGWYVGT